MTRRRLDLEASEENILQTIEDNTLGRNDDIVDCLKLLSDTEGPFTYLLDGAWGSGKTFFVQQLIEVINLLNNRDDQRYARIAGHINNIDSVGAQLIPYYFNAWDNDFFEDPLLAIFSDMADYFGNIKVLKKISINTKELMMKTVNTVLKLLHCPIDVSQLGDAVTIEDITEPFKLRRELREGVSKFLDSVVKENPNYKLVIFIDELDRCKPEFTKRVLEETKNLFIHSNVLLVYITDSSQLAKSLNGIYGSSYDCNRYLERFYDERLLLSPVTGFDYLRSIGVLSNGDKMSFILSDLSKNYGYTIRDANRLKQVIKSVITYTPSVKYNDNNIDQMMFFAKLLILPVMVLLQKEDKSLFDKIVAGEAPDALFEFVRKSPSCMSLIMGALGIKGENENESSDSRKIEFACREYMHNLSIMVYGNKETKEFMDVAAQYFGVSSVQYFDPKVFEELHF